MLVHLGTKPGSKAYCLLEPSSKRIIVNRNVIFSEDKGWSWNMVNLEKGKDSGEEENDDDNEVEEE